MAKRKANAFLLHEGKVYDPGTEIELTDEQIERLGDKTVAPDEKIDAEKGFRDSDNAEKSIEDMNVSELREVAAGYNIEGYSDMRKADLINSINAFRDLEQA